MNTLSDELIEDILQWDVRSWAKAVNYWEEKIDWNSIDSCLELGSKKGGLSLWLALKGKNVVCSDLQNPISIAASFHNKYNISIEYRSINALDIPYKNQFDLIVFKSILGGIGRNGNKQLQQKVINEIYRTLKPNGLFLFAENLSATFLHQYLRKKFVNWGEYWRYISLDEMKEFLANFTSFELKTTGFIASLGRNEMQKKFLAKLDETIFNKCTDESSRSIVYGVAKK